MTEVLPLGKILSIPRGQLPEGNGRYTHGVTKDQIRTANFLRLLREKYRDKPSVFEKATGYPANMVSQIKNGHKIVGEDLAERLEGLLKLDPGALEKPDIDFSAAKPQRSGWPFSFELTEFEGLSPRLQGELDQAFTRLLLGAQAQDLLDKQAKKKRG